jgi:hypothetical protein
VVFWTPDWRRAVDKKIAAERIRARLEKRLANFLGCEVGDLPRFKIGTLINTLFLLLGDTHELGGYFASMDGTLKILGNEIVWDIVETKPEETETPKVVVN